MCLIQLGDQRLASGSLDYTIKLWDLDTNECEVTLCGHTNAVICLFQLTDD